MVIVLAAAGCGKRAAEPPGADPEPEPAPSTARQVIEGMTGKTAVESGKKARATIERVSRERNRDLEEVLE
jgi:hypothetical protein